MFHWIECNISCTAGWASCLAGIDCTRVAGTYCMHGMPTLLLVISTARHNFNMYFIIIIFY